MRSRTTSFRNHAHPEWHPRGLRDERRPQYPDDPRMARANRDWPGPGYLQADEDEGPPPPGVGVYEGVGGYPGGGRIDAGGYGGGPGYQSGGADYARDEEYDDWHGGRGRYPTMHPREPRFAGHAPERRSGYAAGAHESAPYGYGEGGAYRPRPEEDPRRSTYGDRRGGHRGKGPKGYTRSDERILEDLSERLAEDDDIDASDVAIRVDAGKVTLEGSVEQRWIKHRIEDMAEACRGVVDVVNHLRVARTPE